MDYRLISNNLKALSTGITKPITILSNASALLYEALEGLNWCGFYLADNDVLYLGPFQGKVACTVIPFGKGVCGTAAIKNETVLVKNVHEFPGHIACDSASNSEIVIPIHRAGELYGVLDIDSPVLERFTDDDKAGLELVVTTLETTLNSLCEQMF